MIEYFLQQKLAGLLDSYIEFQKLKFTTADGMTIQNSTVKPKMAELLSQVLQMPLELISGSISSLTLNKPWEKLFILVNSPIKISIDGIRLRAKLKNSYNEDYILKKRQNIIDKLTQNLFNPLEASKNSNSYINQKLKEYFLSTLVLQAKNVVIQIQIDLKHRVELILKLDSLVFRKQDKKNQNSSIIRLLILGAGLFYKAVGDKETQLISPTRIQFERVKTEGGALKKRVSQKTLNIEKLHLNVNNINYGDIARVLLLIQWHNSFADIPYQLWTIKPFILTQCRPFLKLKYCVNLLKISLYQQNIVKQLNHRRKYLSLYNKFLYNPIEISANDRKELADLQKYMPVWKIVAYRSFSISLMKKKIQQKSKKNELQVFESEIQRDDKKTEISTSKDSQKKVSSGWFHSWFAAQKDSQILQNQFIQKVNTIELIPYDIESIFNIKVEHIKIRVSIVTESYAIQPFFSLVGMHCQFNFKQLLVQKTWQKSINFRKCKIEYQKYLGHHERYKNCMCESKEHLRPSQLEQQQEQDEFQDINYFLQINFRHDSQIIVVKLLPFDLFINHQIIQKLAVILNIDKLSKITSMNRFQKAYLIHYDPWLIIEQQKQNMIAIKKSLSEERSFTSITSPRKKQSIFDDLPINPSKISSNIFHKQQKDSKQLTKQIRIKSAFNLVIAKSLRQYPSTELLIQVGQLLVTINSLHKLVQLKGILVKGNFEIGRSVQEQEDGVKNMYDYYQQPMQEKIIIRKFNFSLNIQNHDSFDRYQISVSPIKVQVPSQKQIQVLIELLFLHISKSKESRAKQYYRRKQSIGEQFMDACQNLNEHLTKSMIMSSEKQTKKIIMREKRIKKIQINFEGVSITSKSCLILVSTLSIYMNEIGFDQKYLQSHNQKKIKIIIHNIKQVIEDAKIIELHIKKQKIKKGLHSQNQANNIMGRVQNIQIQNINFQLVTTFKKIKIGQPLSVRFQLANISFYEKPQDNRRDVSATAKLSYDEQADNGKRVASVPFIQSCEIYYKETVKFNLHQKSVSINAMNFNIKPSLFKLLATGWKDYNLCEQTNNVLTNGTINTIKVKNLLNYNLQLKHNHKCTIKNHYSEMILFNNKLQLQFNQHRSELPKQKVQCFKISQNTLLINRQISPNNYLLQSNIRILNHQDKTLWIKISQKTSIIMTDQYQESRIHLNNLSLTPQRSFDVDLTQKVIFGDRDHSYNSYRSHSGNKSLNTSPEKLGGKNMNIPLKPKEKMHILIDSQDHKYIQIYDQGKYFTEIKISELFEANQLLLQNEESDQNEYLVIRSQITKKQNIEGLIYTFHIYSPIYIVNKTPWTLDYRLSNQEVVGEQGEEKRLGRRRSFQVLPMKNIQSLTAQKIRNRHYNQIQMMRLSLKKYEREINNLSGLISKIKQKAKNQKQFYKESQLITFRSNRKQIQLILRLQFSKNILKIKIFPQYIFVNLTKIQIKFKVKEDQITYPQVLLQPLQIQQNQQDTKQSKEIKQNQKAYVNNFINLSDDKLKERDVMKQLFQYYQDQLQIFTGTLEDKIKRKIIYDSGDSHLVKSKGGLQLKNSKVGYSDGSDGQVREQNYRRSEHALQQQHSMIYGYDEYILFKRVLQVQQYFNLVMITPTVHIINKSTATFYAKSSCERLVKIGKQSHNYILANQSIIDLQGCLEEEDISLSEWIQVRLDSFGTIYYSKDMIQHHGSGYESKEYTFRKKRMKKTPKIFYKVLLCKFERGQKIIIQESQYPPISFLNNTKHRIKIEQVQEHFIEELIQKGNMGEYAPKDPYHKPEFKLSIAEHYQYTKIKQFKVEEKQIFHLEKDIILAIQQYKDKIIVNIKDKQHPNLSISYIDRSNDKNDKNQLLLEQVKKITFSIDHLYLAIMNSWNKQLNSTIIDSLRVVYQNKNSKDYYRVDINDIEGYDYMDMQPDYIFRRNKKQKVGLSLLQREKHHLQENFISFELVVNMHKNAVILEKCQCKITESVFYISGQLILAYIKNYYYLVSEFKAVLQYYKGSHSDNKKISFLYKTFIIESLHWHGTALKFQTRNLSIMQTFLNRSYQKWIVKFINWLGDVKPISLSSLQLNYQQITLFKLAKQVDLRKKLTEVGTVLMDYPLSQLKEVFMLFIGDEQKSIMNKISTLYKIAKSFEYIVSFTLGLNQNLKNRMKSYKQTFIEENKDNTNVIDKIIQFQYCQWKYQKTEPVFKLNKKIKRLQRYNTRDQIIPFNDFKAKIKLALDSFINNKLFRPINDVHRLNQDSILALVNEWIIIFNIKLNEWIVIQLQHFLSCRLQRRDLLISYWQRNEDREKYDSILQNKGSQVKQIQFRQAEITQDRIKQILECVHDNILSYYY